MAIAEASRSWRDIFFTNRDGLRLHARHYPANSTARRPVVCLPGLTRNAKDFHLLAERLASPKTHRRDVFCVDYRGRGLSDHDPDWRNYTPFIECLDVLDLMTMAGVHEAALVGTSRGGIIAMLMAVLRPAALGAVVLNDIGPVIERDGLTRILGYAGKVPLPASWEEAARMVKDMNARQFPGIRDTEWAEIARQWFNDEGGLPGSSYDPAIARTLSAVNAEGPPPAMWAQFKALKRLPVLAIRGANSDILSAETFKAMGLAHPDLRSLTVQSQGHAPHLRDEQTTNAIGEFLAESDASYGQSGAAAGVAA